MKTQKIRVRNLSESLIAEGYSVHVKPIAFLTALLAIGAILIICNKDFIFTGLSLIVTGICGITIFPDRSLITFLDDHMVLYNQSDRSMCMLVYYDEVVHWQYEYHKSYDQLIFSLVDGSREVQEMYSLNAVSAQLNKYMKGKGLRSVWVRKERA